ncbi:hypothetical protein ATE67_06190 [Sphingopyxis sp. H050]|uniref:hypothetical protein n=1 Tax=Sphingopyxis sp. H050 TaxID=1759072 RepID=UPI000736427D|nr:hypothetical protein ATE67_06190 [Sphingopyxis sp. H050]
MNVFADAACRDRCERSSISFIMTAGQVSDCTGACALLDGPPKAQGMMADEAMAPTGSMLGRLKAVT